VIQKAKNQKLEARFLGNNAAPSLEKARFCKKKTFIEKLCQISQSGTGTGTRTITFQSRNRNSNKSLRFHNTGSNAVARIQILVLI
jgi:hypothetical protein